MHLSCQAGRHSSTNECSIALSSDQMITIHSNDELTRQESKKHLRTPVACVMRICLYHTKFCQVGHGEFRMT